VLFITLLAEVNRAPFDMPEAEQELVAGYHTEYSGMKFALFFMAEYGKMIVVSAVLATMFFGGYLGPGVKAIPWLGPLYLGIKIFISLFVMIWIRATFPRIRYDRLMAFGWKVLLPLSLALVFITALGILLEVKWLIPVLSLGAGWVATSMVNRALRRKEYAR
jgi:NADH-quinone oxidoreductase subunit H